jgi:hypothetical protein
MIPTQLTYRERLQPWCIVRQLPNLQRIVVARFSRRNDAPGIPRRTATLASDCPSYHPVCRCSRADARSRIGCRDAIALKIKSFSLTAA